MTAYFAAIQFPLDSFNLFGLEVHAFGMLVGLGIILGATIAGKRAKAMGLSERVIADVAMWAVIPGFIGAHLGHQLFYYPEEIAQDPWVLLKIWQGISSFGGFVGGTLGVLYYFFKKNKGLPFLPYADALIYGFTFAWIFGRLGCTVAFDHPGVETDFFMGMVYGGHAVIDGIPLNGKVIHNLGWYEALWSVVMFAYYWIQRKKPRFPGWYLAVFVIAYMPFRFGIDFLRVVDKTYAGLTPAQWGSIALLAIGIALLFKGNQSKERLVPYGEPKLEAWPPGEAQAYRKEQQLLARSDSRNKKKA